MGSIEQQLIEKTMQLPPQRIAEVADFVDFLRAREEETGLIRAAARLGEARFAAVWDNDEDAACDSL